jgi:predicted trehalose synthase
MLGSFDYAAASALDEGPAVCPRVAQPTKDKERGLASRPKQAFLAGYRAVIADRPSFPRNGALLIEIFVLEKTLCEICDQAANRSGWIRIPLTGVMEIIDHGK